jgi:hypothetical protein
MEQWFFIKIGRRDHLQCKQINLQLLELYNSDALSHSEVCYWRGSSSWAGSMLKTQEGLTDPLFRHSASNSECVRAPRKSFRRGVALMSNGNEENRLLDQCFVVKPITRSPARPSDINVIHCNHGALCHVGWRPFPARTPSIWIINGSWSTRVREYHHPVAAMPFGIDV